MSRTNRLLVILAVGISLPIVGYFAAWALFLAYAIFFSAALACGNNCSDSDWVARDITIGLVAAYVVIMGLGVWWVTKGAPKE